MRPPVRSHCRREWRGGPETKVLDPGPASGRGRAPVAGPPALAPTGDVAKDGTERLDNALATAITSQPTSAPSTSDPPIRPRRRRWPLVAVVSGVMLMTAAALWRSLAVPALVRFPTDVDQHPRYEGTFTLFVDPATALPLDTPSTAALSIDRSVQGVPGESTGERVLVRETIAYAFEGSGPVEQIHQYVMDRRTGANVDDPAAWAFEPSNQLDRSGAYWVAMPRSLRRRGAGHHVQGRDRHDVRGPSHGLDRGRRTACGWWSSLAPARPSRSRTRT